jgi:hypothetical protein
MGLIVESEVDAPLRQGDILCNILLYETADDGDAPVPVEVEHVLVLSRHCNAARKQTVIVAAIKDITPTGFFEQLKELSLDDARRYLAAVRDGDGKPDRFYLGPLPGREVRSFTCLDRIYSIQLPKDGSARQDWVRSRRRGTLSDEHRRHLHTTLLLAFGREGFDDYAWWPDADLKLMMDVGNKALAKAAMDEADIERERQAAMVEPDEKRAAGRLQTNKSKAESVAKEKKQAKDALEQYLAEWERRHNDEGPVG